MKKAFCLALAVLLIFSAGFSASEITDTPADESSENEGLSEQGEVVQPTSEERKELPQTTSPFTVTKKKSVKWKLAFGIASIIAIAVIIAFYFPTWYKKKSKSFGF